MGGHLMLVLDTAQWALNSDTRGLMLCMFQLSLKGPVHILRVEKSAENGLSMFCESKFDLYTTFYFCDFDI